MNAPIVDPSTLTEEQREAIRKEFIDVDELTKILPLLLVKIISIMNLPMVKIFGKDFFEKGENK